jgi:hypothetical protein
VVSAAAAAAGDVVFGDWTQRANDSVSVPDVLAIHTTLDNLLAVQTTSTVSVLAAQEPIEGTGQQVAEWAVDGDQSAFHNQVDSQTTVTALCSSSSFGTLLLINNTIYKAIQQPGDSPLAFWIATLLRWRC